jgi:hypothetical protein
LSLSLLTAALARKARREIAFFLLIRVSPGLHYRAVADVLRKQFLGFAETISEHPAS